MQSLCIHNRPRSGSREGSPCGTSPSLPRHNPRRGCERGGTVERDQTSSSWLICGCGQCSFGWILRLQLLVAGVGFCLSFLYLLSLREGRSNNYDETSCVFVCIYKYTQHIMLYHSRKTQQQKKMLPLICSVDL